MQQAARTKIEAGAVSFVVQHELWDGNLQDHSDQGVVILVEANDTTLLRFNCFDIERSYIYGPEGKNKLCRMDPVVDGNPIMWTVKQIKNNLPAMLTEAGYEDVASSVNMDQVKGALGEVESCARETLLHRSQHRQAQPRPRHLRGRQHPLRAGTAQAGRRRRRPGHSRPLRPGRHPGPHLHRRDRASGLRLLPGRPPLPLRPPEQEPPHLLGPHPGA